MSATDSILILKPDINRFAKDCQTLLDYSPVVHAIPVVASAHLVANALHAVGASPVMAILPREIPALHRICASVVLSLGSPDRNRFHLLNQVARSAANKDLPTVIDPVGVVFSQARLRWAQHWILRKAGYLIRGNHGEINALFGRKTGAQNSAIDAAKDVLPNPWESNPGTSGAFAPRHTILSTGKVDFLWAGSLNYQGSRGHPYLAQVTGMGCALSAICGAFLAVNPNRFEAALHALWLVNAAAERAAPNSSGPGTFAWSWLDSLAWLMKNPTESWIEIPEGANS